MNAERKMSYRGYDFTIKSKSIGYTLAYTIEDNLGKDCSPNDMHYTFDKAVEYEKEKIDNHMTNLEKA